MLPESLISSRIDPDTYGAARIYETILATTDDFAYIFDPQGRFLYANARLLKVWAKTLDEVIGKTCHELGYPTWHADMHMREIAEVVRTKKAIRGEVPFTGDSGISGIYDYLFQPVLDAANEVEVIVGTTRDITERKRAEEELKAMQAELQTRAEELQAVLAAKSDSEERYRFLTDSMPQIAWTARPDGNLDYYNQRWFNYAGTTPEEMERVGWTFFVHSEDLPNAAKVWQNALETGCDYEVEFRLKRASDQSYRWHLVRAVPMKNAEGQIVQWFGTCTDIDDTRLLQQKLSESAAKFESLFDQSTAFAGIMTLNGILIEANHTSLEGCGYRPEEALGKPFWKCGWWSGSESVQEKIRLGTKSAAQGNTYSETLPYWFADGTERIVEFSLGPIRDANGTVIFLTPTGLDVTERERSHAQTGFLAHLTQKLSTLSDASEINRIATEEIGQFLKVSRCYCMEVIPGPDRIRVLPDWRVENETSLEGEYSLSAFGSPELAQALSNGPLCIDDVQTHSLTKDFVASYAPLKLRAYASAPFIRDKKWVACIGVASNKPRHWSNDEIALLENAAVRVWPLIERANIEGTLRKGEEALSRIAAVVESSDDAIISKSLEGIITSWNKGAERIFGYTPEEAIGQSVFLLIPPDLQKDEPGILERLKRGERIEHFETIRLTKDGRPVHISLSVSPVKDRTGKIVGASKIARDITEDKKRQEALRESEARFRNLADSAPMLIWVAGPDKLCSYFNRTWLDFVGRTTEQEIGMGWAEGLHPDDRDRCLQIYATALDAHQPFEMECRLRHHSGEYRWILDKGIPRFGPNGTFQGYIGACVDITEAVQARQSSAERREELERLVNERTLSLREAIGQMEEFSYSVSHDLRAPLRAMQGYATALLEDYRGKIIDAEGEDYLQRIITAGLRMDRLTRDVLVYSKIPREEMQLRTVSLDRLAFDIVQQYLHSKAESANIAIETPLLPVIGNESFLAQAISNLVDNAVKFASKERPLQIRIWTETNQDQVRLWVEDNGIGIKKEHQARIWGMFERVHPQHMYDGTGIGLAIVRKTIERMNGTMGVESDGVSGSKFWIQLPGV